MKRKLIYSFISIILIIIVLNFGLLSYALKMGYNQVKIVWNAKAIDKILDDSSSPDSLKARLIFAQKVRKFAMSKLGLKNSENYTKLYDQNGKAILFNLSASDKYSLKAKRWSFPIIGSFPYKGFFDLEEAKSEAKILKDMGLDVRIRSVGAWSTLGWFNDPILSNMLNRSDGDLAEVIIHELTHSTIFIKDSITVNENLASFIGTEGAKQFLLSELKDTVAYKKYILDDLDYKLFMNHMLKGAIKLDSLYNNPLFKKMEPNQKDTLKQKMIRKIVNRIDSLDFNQKRRYRFSAGLNNAHFMSFKRYHEKENVFETIFRNEYNNDIIDFIRAMKKKYPND